MIASPAPRSPEEARRIMSALQAGTARGRAAATGTTPRQAAPATDRPDPPRADPSPTPADPPSADPNPTPAEQPVDTEPRTATERDA